MGSDVPVLWSGLDVPEPIWHCLVASASDLDTTALGPRENPSDFHFGPEPKWGMTILTRTSQVKRHQRTYFRRGSRETPSHAVLPYRRRHNVVFCRRELSDTNFACPRPLRFVLYLPAAPLASPVPAQWRK